MNEMKNNFFKSVIQKNDEILVNHRQVWQKKTDWIWREIQASSGLGPANYIAMINIPFIIKFLMHILLISVIRPKSVTCSL